EGGGATRLQGPAHQLLGRVLRTGRAADAVTTRRAVLERDGGGGCQGILDEGANEECCCQDEDEDRKDDDNAAAGRNLAFTSDAHGRALGWMGGCRSMNSILARIGWCGSDQLGARRISQIR